MITLFGDKLKELRKAHGMTQGQVGQKIGISPRVIGFYEVNDRFPKDEKTLIDIANLFNVSVDYLLDHETDSEDKEDAAQRIYEIFREKGFIVEGQKVDEEVLDTISDILDTAIANAERVAKIHGNKK